MCVHGASVQLACRRLYVEQHSVSYLRGIMWSIRQAQRPYSKSYRLWKERQGQKCMLVMQANMGMQFMT